METIILSVGGSIICPDKPDHYFLREFKNFVISRLGKYRFVIVCGGGKTNSYYNEAAKRISEEIPKDDLDWLGIMATRLNAELVRVMFGDLAEKEVIYDPEKKISMKKDILLAAGYKPGWSTDYDAVLIARQLGVKKILNLTNISFVYDKDPAKHKDAKRLFEVSWKDYRKIVGSKWTPRMNSPFDPIASKEAQKARLEVAVLKGTDLKNVDDYLEGRHFLGTVIR